MKRIAWFALAFGLGGMTQAGVAQSSKQPEVNTTAKKKPKAQPPLPVNDPAPSADHPTSEGGGESSSRDTQVDLSPPGNDRQEHPGPIDGEDVSEFRNYDPHKAMKNIEVGDFYFKRKNYRAAAERYKEALTFKPKDAEATYKLAESADKMENFQLAREKYDEYLKILPHGPEAEEAKKSLARLK